MTWTNVEDRTPSEIGEYEVIFLRFEMGPIQDFRQLKSTPISSYEFIGKCIYVHRFETGSGSLRVIAWRELSSGQKNLRVGPVKNEDIAKYTK